MQSSLLGSTVKDRISGFEGTVIGEAQYLYAMETVLVQPPGLNDCKPMDAVWFVTERVEVLKRESKVGFKMHKAAAAPAANGS